MSDQAIAVMIREVLAEELEKLGRKKKPGAAKVAPKLREETVSITSDADLAGFARLLLAYADDKKARADIVEGRLVFRLASAKGASSKPAPKERAADTSAPVAPPPPAASPSSAEAGAVVVPAGFFSEKQVHELPKGTKLVKVGKAVKLTPLARDRLAHRGIKIERTDT